MIENSNNNDLRKLFFEPWFLQELSKHLTFKEFGTLSCISNSLNEGKTKIIK